MIKILVIFTGGTIGSKMRGGVIDTDGCAGETLLRAFAESTQTKVVFDAIQPMSLLSENLLPKHWETLYRALLARDLTQYDGIVITHGSDTLPYTSAAFGFLLCGLQKPVVFVASNRGIGEPGSNGLENFTAAVQFVQNAGLPGVFAVFKDNREHMTVYLGTRLLEADYMEDQYHSYAGIDFGEMIGGRFFPCAHDKNPDAKALFALPKRVLAAEVRFQRPVFYIVPHPGLDYALFALEATRPAAILHGLYHSSTACVEPEAHSLAAFAAKCARMGIDLYLYDCRHMTDPGIYRTCKRLLASGAQTLSGISREAALAKLLVAYHQEVLSPREYMRKDCWFEYII
ncbi:MAG: asparaginase domain-containing protein [Oscillospiraceae bacterium]|nr:asparaginase domain-containing protein [Oscillospiraceae bacterium]